MIARQVAADAGRQYVDVRALLLDPVDLRGNLWRDADRRTRWAPPAFLPPTDHPGLFVNRRNGLDPSVERALFRGTMGEAAAVEFSAFLKVWREQPHSRAVIDDPENAVVPENANVLIALCGSLYRMADDINLGAIVSYATRLRREIGEFLVGSCIRRDPVLQRSPAFIRWAAARTQ